MTPSDYFCGVIIRALEEAGAFIDDQAEEYIANLAAQVAEHPATAFDERLRSVDI